MPRKRKPLSFNHHHQTEAQLEEFVLQGVTNFQGEPAWANAAEIEVELERILLPDFQLRLYSERSKIEQIKATIQSFGIREPLLLRPHPEKKDYFELVAGSQRRLAAEELALSVVPVKVDEVDDLTALKIAILENEARSDPNPYEKARGTLRLLEMSLNKSTEEVTQLLIVLFNAENRGSDNNDMITAQESQLIWQIFAELGMNWKSFITNQLPLFKMPDDIKKVLERGELEYTKALKIAKVEDEQKRHQLLEEVKVKGLSVREIQQRISQIQPPKNQSEAAALRERARTVLKKATSPQLMKDPDNIKQIKKIVNQLEALLEKAQDI